MPHCLPKVHVAFLEPDFFLYDVTKLDKPRKGSIIGGTRIEDFVTLEVHSQKEYELWMHFFLK